MNTRILLLAAGVAALSSCSSVYKSGQTPDDVYYSPVRPQEEYVEVQKDEDKYQSYVAYQDAYRNDRFLRLSVQNRYYRGMYDAYDNYDWRYNAYAYNYNSPWNNYWSWNNFYNPYCTPVIYTGYPKGGFVQPVSRPVAFNVNSYKPITNGAGSYRGSYYYNNSNGTRYNSINSLGNSFQKAFSGSNNNSYTPSTNTSTPTRTYTPSTSSSSSSSGSSSSGSSGGGGVTRPTRGN
jgi:hypothetical protein